MTQSLPEGAVPQAAQSVDLDRGPRFAECETSEPSLRMLVHKYYEAHFGLEDANLLAMRYLRELPAPPAQAVPVAPSLWTALNEWLRLEETHQVARRAIRDPAMPDRLTPSQIQAVYEAYEARLPEVMRRAAEALAAPTSAPQEPVAPTPEPVARKPILYVPRATADGDTFIKGELYLSEVSETPFDVRDRDNFECVALYDHPAVDLQVLLWARDSLAACNMPTTRIDALYASPPKGATQDSAGEPAAWRYKDTHGHWRYTGTKPDAYHVPLLKPEPLYATQAPAADNVGDTRFEGWLSEYVLAPAEQPSATRYIKQDLREAYWAGYCERGATQDAGKDEGIDGNNFLGTGKSLDEWRATLATQDSPQEALNARSPWISVEERLPPMWEEVIVHPAPTDYCMVASVDRAGLWHYGEYDRDGQKTHETSGVTHWMPLPVPPADSASPKDQP